MNACVRILFKHVNDEAWETMKFLAEKLTNRKKSIRVFADEEPGWLVAEFTMPTEPQYVAVETVEHAIRMWAFERLHSTIGFPQTEAQAARAARKNAKQRAKRKAARVAREAAKTLIPNVS